MFNSNYLVCAMESDYYDYEQQHAIRDDEHDYEEEDYDIDNIERQDGYYDDLFDDREDLGWDGQLED